MRGSCWRILGRNELKMEEVVIAMVLAEIYVAYKRELTVMVNPIENRSGNCVLKG